MRSLVSAPASRSTIPALMPVPPMSTPTAVRVAGLVAMRAALSTARRCRPWRGVDGLVREWRAWTRTARSTGTTSRPARSRRASKSPSVDRAGPFDTAEEAARAPEVIRERSRAWAEEEAREDR